VSSTLLVKKQYVARRKQIHFVRNHANRPKNKCRCRNSFTYFIFNLQKRKLYTVLYNNIDSAVFMCRVLKWKNPTTSQTFYSELYGILHIRYYSIKSRRESGKKWRTKIRTKIKRFKLLEENTNTDSRGRSRWTGFFLFLPPSTPPAPPPSSPFPHAASAAGAMRPKPPWGPAGISSGNSGRATGDPPLSRGSQVGPRFLCRVRIRSLWGVDELDGVRQNIALYGGC
jgi:hypothetical protein